VGAGAGPEADTDRPQVVPASGVALLAEFHDVELGGRTLRVRLPWSAIGLADPSSKQALLPGDGQATTTPVDRIGLDVRVDDRTVPKEGIGWQPWQRTFSQARVKAGIQVFADAVAEVTPS
jgi:hypothetical protein